MSEKLVLIRKEDSVGTITINRPRFMNAVTIEVIAAILDAFRKVASDGNIRVIIFEGAGGNFSVGADMSLLDRDTDSSQWLTWMKTPIGKLILTMRKIPQPIICKVQGNVIGYGVGMALASDFVIASEAATFREVFVNLGVTLDGGASYFLPRLVGMARAREIALLGNVIDAKTAASIGLIYKCVPEGDLEQEVKTLAATLSNKPPQAVRTIKDVLEKSLDMTLEEALDWEASHQAILLTGDELKRAAKRFLNGHKKTD